MIPLLDKKKFVLRGQPVVSLVRTCTPCHTRHTSNLSERNKNLWAFVLCQGICMSFRQSPVNISVVKKCLCSHAYTRSTHIHTHTLVATRRRAIRQAKKTKLQSAGDPLLNASSWSQRRAWAYAKSSVKRAALIRCIRVPREATALSKNLRRIGNRFNKSKKQMYN